MKKKKTTATIREKREEFHHHKPHAMNQYNEKIAGKLTPGRNITSHLFRRQVHEVERRIWMMMRWLLETERKVTMIIASLSFSSSSFFFFFFFWEELGESLDLRQPVVQQSVKEVEEIPHVSTFLPSQDFRLQLQLLMRLRLRRVFGFVWVRGEKGASNHGLSENFAGTTEMFSGITEMFSGITEMYLPAPHDCWLVVSGFLVLVLAFHQSKP